MGKKTFAMESHAKKISVSLKTKGCQKVICSDDFWVIKLMILGASTLGSRNGLGMGCGHGMWWHAFCAFWGLYLDKLFTVPRVIFRNYGVKLQEIIGHGQKNLGASRKFRQHCDYHVPRNITAFN